MSGELTADPKWVGVLTEAGFDRAERWRRELAAGEQSSGRGTTAVLRLDGWPALRLKQMRRGGLVGPLWRDRYPGRSRALANYRLPREAIARGVATPCPVALMTLAGPPGLVRAWLALEEIEPAEDLMRMLREGRPPDAAGWRALIDAVRALHDAGVEHPDLNLGNLLLQPPATGWVLDLDRARLHPDPLAPELRERALARMERSFARAIDPDPAAGEAFAARIRDLYSRA